MTYTNNIATKLYQYFTSKLILRNSTQGWKRTNCVFDGCDGKNTMGINFESSKAHCFKCGEHKSLIYVLMDMEQFETIHQARAYLNIQEEYESFDYLLTKKKEKVERRAIELPDSFKLLAYQTKSILGQSAGNYIKGRGFSIEKLSRKGVGYCTRGPYSGYIIFPIYEKGELIFYQGRRYTEAGATKMKNPAYEDFGIGKSELIYNADALYMYKTCYMMESITNCETMGDRGFGILGKKASAIQYNKIIHSPCENLIILLDPDAIMDSIKFAMSVCQIKKIKLVELPEGEDVNSIGKKETMKFVKNTNWGTYQDFFKLKLHYEGTRGSYN